MTGRLRLLALSISLLLLVFLAGCSDSVSPDKRDSVSVQQLLSRTSPENVLFNLRLIYGDKDGLVTTAEEAQYWAEEYRKLFHPDFKFFFVPGDAPTDSFPEGYWGVENEVSSFEHMLLAIAGQPPVDLWALDDIRLMWTYGASVPDQRIDPGTQELLHPDWQHVIVYGIILDIIATDPADFSFLALGAADFYFGPDPADRRRWVITEWWDKPPDY